MGYLYVLLIEEKERLYKLAVAAREKGPAVVSFSPPPPPPAGERRPEKVAARRYTVHAWHWSCPWVDITSHLEEGWFLYPLCCFSGQ